MNYKIRHYNDSEYQTIRSWWTDLNEVPPLQDMLPEESSYIFEVDGQPSICVTLYLTNSKAFCMIDNLICSPLFKEKGQRREAIELFKNYIDGVVKEKGFARILCMTEKPALKKRYMELGYRPTLDGVTTFIKEIV